MTEIFVAYPRIISVDAERFLGLDDRMRKKYGDELPSKVKTGMGDGCMSVDTVDMHMWLSLS